MSKLKCLDDLGRYYYYLIFLLICISALINKLTFKGNVPWTNKKCVLQNTNEDFERKLKVLTTFIIQFNWKILDQFLMVAKKYLEHQNTDSEMRSLPSFHFCIDVWHDSANFFTRRSEISLHTDLRCCTAEQHTVTQTSGVSFWTWRIFRNRTRTSAKHQVSHFSYGQKKICNMANLYFPYCKP